MAISEHLVSMAMLELQGVGLESGKALLLDVFAWGTTLEVFDHCEFIMYSSWLCFQVPSVLNLWMYLLLISMWHSWRQRASVCALIRQPGWHQSQDPPFPSLQNANPWDLLYFLLIGIISKIVDLTSRRKIVNSNAKMTGKENTQTFN